MFQRDTVSQGEILFLMILVWKNNSKMEFLKKVSDYFFEYRKKETSLFCLELSNLSIHHKFLRSNS